jgi:hypothetical protein
MESKRCQGTERGLVVLNFSAPHIFVQILNLPDGLTSATELSHFEPILPQFDGLNNSKSIHIHFAPSLLRLP